MWLHSWATTFHEMFLPDTGSTTPVARQLVSARNVLTMNGMGRLLSFGRAPRIQSSGNVF